MTETEFVKAFEQLPIGYLEKLIKLDVIKETDEVNLVIDKIRAWIAFLEVNEWMERFDRMALPQQTAINQYCAELWFKIIDHCFRLLEIEDILHKCAQVEMLKALKPAAFEQESADIIAKAYSETISKLRAEMIGVDLADPITDSYLKGIF